MFNIPMLLFIIAIMTIVQISVWQIFPPKLRDLMMANPVLAFLINLSGSCMIMSFTGAASIVGICNMGASVLFAVYAIHYSKKQGIKGVSIRSYKLFNAVPIIPKLCVVYEKDGKWWEA